MTLSRFSYWTLLGQHESLWKRGMWCHRRHARERSVSRASRSWIKILCYLCQSLMYLFQIGMWSNVILEISNMYRLGIYVADPLAYLLEPENLLPFSFFEPILSEICAFLGWICNSWRASLKTAEEGTRKWYCMEGNCLENIEGNRGKSPRHLFF